MVILVNFGKPLKVEYTSNSHNKGYSKLFPTNSFVAFKDLRSIDQISNRGALVRANVTIWEYETNTFLNRNPDTPTGATLPLVFIDNNVKPSQFTVARDGYSGTTTQSGMTITADNLLNSTIFEFATTDNTSMIGAATASTVGNNFAITFNSTSAATTTDWYGAISAATIAKGIAITGFGTSLLDTDTFYLSATTADVNSGFVFLQNLV